MLQAVALSHLPQQRLQALQGRGLQAAQLTSLVEWFQRTIRQGEDRRVTPEESQQVLAASESNLCQTIIVKDDDLSVALYAAIQLTV